jgi:hypothetical protein
MSRNNQNKTVSCNSNGIVISYGDANKHQFMKYETPAHVKKIQLEGTVKYQKIEEEFKLTPKQKDVYAKTVYGFKAYTKEELNALSEHARIEVTIKYSKVQRILRNWKQDITFSNLDRFLLSLFPNSPVIKAMCTTTGHIDDVPKNDEISFKELGIKQEHIIAKLMQVELLPKNFYELA